jgi:chemotaxis protein MotB
MKDEGTYQIHSGGSSRGLVVATLLMTAIAVGFGFAGYRLYTETVTQRGELTRLANEKKTLSDALELHRATSVDLDGKLAKCSNELTTEKTTSSETEQKRVGLEVELSSCTTKLKDLKQDAAEAKEMLAEMKSLTRSFQRMIDAGKLGVTFRRGQMVVNLPAQVLFPSGSAELSPDGAAALGEVAGVLRKLRGRKFTVAGHTDDIAVAQAEFKDNWSLSSARAVGVTRLLVAKGMPASSLVAAGFGEFDPIATNHTPTGRQKNRRIEIILEPNLKPVAAMARK